MATDPYSTLGVGKTASEADIKKAYRKLAKELHPDTNKDNPKAAERFSRVTGAYDLLSDKDKRARFDRGEIDGDGNPANPFAGFQQGAARGGGRAGPGGFEFADAATADLGDFFDGLFGGRRGGFGGRSAGPSPRGGNIAYSLSVPFEDAATLKTQRITLADGKTIDLKLSPGVENGAQLRLGGKGRQGPGGAGDAIVTIEVKPHRFFVRDGDHIRLDLPITLNEAVLGGPVKVPTVEGPVMINVPKGSTSGKTLRLKGRGFAGKGGARGDQLVTVMVDLPTGDEPLSKFAESWSDTRNPRAALGV